MVQFFRFFDVFDDEDEDEEDDTAVDDDDDDDDFVARVLDDFWSVPWERSRARARPIIGGGGTYGVGVTASCLQCSDCCCGGCGCSCDCSCDCGGCVCSGCGGCGCDCDSDSCDCSSPCCVDDDDDSPQYCTIVSLGCGDTDPPLSPTTDSTASLLREGQVSLATRGCVELPSTSRSSPCPDESSSGPCANSRASPGP